MLVEIIGKRYEEKLLTTSVKVAEMFTLTTYKAGNNHEYRMYTMDRDGFSLLAMGFTGEEALRWKLDYIKAFNAMADELKQVESMEMLVSSLINCGWGYDQIKGFVQENSAKMLA